MSWAGLAGCGDDDDVGVGGTSTTVGDTSSTVGDTSSTVADDTTTSTTADQGGTTVVPPSSFAELTIEVNDGSTAKQATLTCGDTPTGTGYLADAAAAAAACDLLQNNAEARKRLIEGAPSDRQCTQIYGGPETATVEGTIEGRAVRTSVARNDGCGIAEWEMLKPLLGAPAS